MSEAGQETTRLFHDVRDGAAGAESAFYERCARKLLPLIRIRMGPALRAELESRDILQAVLLKGFERLDQVQDPAAVMGWFARIAENEIRDHAAFARRARRDVARRAPLDDAAAVPAAVRQALSVAIINEDMARLERAMDTLPDDQRELIVLRLLEELTFPEIGQRLGRSPDTCRMAFARAMSALTLAVAGLERRG